jgi:hypothetical protein
MCSKAVAFDTHEDPSEGDGTNTTMWRRQSRDGARTLLRLTTMYNVLLR